MKTHSIRKVVLYDEGTSEKLDLEEIARYLRGKLGKVPVEIRDHFISVRPGKVAEYARELASIKIHDINRRITSEQEPLYGEVQYEQRRISGKAKAFGVIYEGVRLQRRFLELIAGRERTPDLVHIFFTNRLFATWGKGDRRYHARTSVYGFPSIVSTTGLVEAPARPKEYYFLKSSSRS